MRIAAPILFFILSMWRSASAQEFIRISATIADHKTQAPLPFATIGIRGMSIGAVSNDFGEFEFFVPAEMKNDTLFISYVGYRTFTGLVRNMESIAQIDLDEIPVLLQEVTVRGDGARKLVEAALKAIPEVLPASAYLMEGFHRSWEKVDFTDSITYPGTLIEAAVTVFDPGYSPKGKGFENIYVEEIRRSSMKEFWNYNGNILETLLQGNLVRHRQQKPPLGFLKSFLDFPNELEYEWEGTKQLNGENLSIIKIEIPNSRNFPAFYRVYISEVDRAILQFELIGAKKEIDYSIGNWHTEKLEQIYVFRRLEDKVYLSFVRLQYQIKNLDQKKQKVIRTEDYFREFMVNNLVVTNVIEKQKTLGEASKKHSLALDAGKYNENFWKTYNVIKENPLDRNIISFFEQSGSLTEQFRKTEELKKNKKKVP